MTLTLRRRRGRTPRIDESAAIAAALSLLRLIPSGRETAIDRRPAETRGRRMSTNGR